MYDPAHFLPSFVWRADRDGIVRYVNPWASRYLGIPAPEIIGRSWREFVHPKDINSVLDALRTMELIYRIYCADPEWRERYHLTMD